MTLNTSHPYGLMTVRTAENYLIRAFEKMIEYGFEGRLISPVSCWRSDNLLQAQGGSPPWAVFAVIGLRDEKILGIFSSSWSRWTIRTPPLETDRREVEEIGGHPRDSAECLVGIDFSFADFHASASFRSDDFYRNPFSFLMIPKPSGSVPENISPDGGSPLLTKIRNGRFGT
jgi:hypothetical protein